MITLSYYEIIDCQSVDILPSYLPNPEETKAWVMIYNVMMNHYRNTQITAEFSKMEDGDFNESRYF